MGFGRGFGGGFVGLGFEGLGFFLVFFGLNEEFCFEKVLDFGILYFTGFHSTTEGFGLVKFAKVMRFITCFLKKSNLVRNYSEYFLLDDKNFLVSLN